MIDTLVALALLLGGALGAVALVAVYILFFPDKFERIVGWIATGIAKAWRKADKTAVAMRVQGQVNGLQAAIQRDAPEMIDKRLKIHWADAEEAEAVVRGGEVIVFMKDSRRHEENLANALMAFLPKALLARARRYVEPDTMRAVDLTVAKALLSHDDAAEGALDAFYDRHLDPARAGSERLKQKIAEIDQIDLHGWLSRILLTEYRRVGEALHPAEPDAACIEEAEKFAEWLYKLAARKKDELGSLTFRGNFFSVAIIFVAHWKVLSEVGVEPYRKRAKRHLYTDRIDSVYLLARDPNLGAVDELVESLGEDAMIGARTRHTYRLRRDFQARQKLQREFGICVCLRRRQIGDLPEAEDDNSGLPEEGEYAPGVLPAADVGEVAVSPAAETVPEAR